MRRPPALARAVFAFPGGPGDPVGLTLAPGAPYTCAGIAS
jgi:hypothetical protein